MCDKYLLAYHENTILELLQDPDDIKHFSININFIELFENDPTLGNSLLKTPENCLGEWNKALIVAQNSLMLKYENNFKLKNRVHCRIYSLIRCPELHKNIFPTNDDANKFLQISGTVVRMTCTKILEYQKLYKCNKCKFNIVVKAEYENRNIIKAPKSCTNPESCNSTNMVSEGEIVPEFCKDYQEIKIQESVTKFAVGSMPSSMWVTLEDDLVDTCKPGDNITICGVVKRRWGQFVLGKKMEIELVLKANHIQVNNDTGSAALVTPEIKTMIENFWQTYANNPLAARDIILKSICPQLFGLHLVKLAIAVVLAGGSSIQDTSGSGVKIRSEPHLLLVGDPGTGKSHLLRFASKIIPRSVLTTGVGSTAAGLTVTAVMEGGEWQLEGGALVLADGGICCIDEFNSMKPHDRTSIHEAMEQQTISVAKASIVCKLSTKCSILAATNPKGNLDSSQPLYMNIALASPLLSRFDLILLLKDSVNANWDNLVTDYILNNENHGCKLTENIFWTIEILQAYFAIIKKKQPILTLESNKILSSYYQAQRRKNSRNKSRTTVRLLDSLVRLSQGHAKLMYHKKVEILDAVMAVMLVETAMDPESSVFNLQFDIQSDFPDSPMNHYKVLAAVILKKLQLEDVLQQELNSLTKLHLTNDNNSIEINGNDKKVRKTVESKYFPPTSISENISNENIDNQEKWNKANHKRKRQCPDNISQKADNNLNKNIGQDHKSIVKGNISEKLKRRKIGNNIASDLAVLNQLPTVNDINLTFSGSVENIDDINFEDANIVTSTQIKLNNEKNINVDGDKTSPPKKLILNENNECVDNTIIQENKTIKPTKHKELLKKFRFRPKIDTNIDYGKLSSGNNTNKNSEDEGKESRPSQSSTSRTVQDISQIRSQTSSKLMTSVFENSDEDLDLDF